MAHGLTAVGDMQAVKQGEDGAVERGQDEHGRFAGELQAVLAQVGISPPVAAVLNTPVCAQPGEQLGGGGTAGGHAGKPIDDFAGVLDALPTLPGDGAFELEDLLHPEPAVRQIANPGIGKAI